jgi:hypothetical protein
MCFLKSEVIMSANTSLDKGIEMGLASYARQEPQTITTVTRNNMPVEKRAMPEVLPKTGTISAREFLQKVVWAGLYDETGKRTPFCQDKAQKDLRHALAAYCGLTLGYKDHKGNLHPAPTLAQQVEMAKLHARAELDRKFVAPTPQKPSLADEGVVNGVRGMPDNVSKHVSNLRARERGCVETIIGFEAAVREARDVSDREIALAKRALETARLVTIRKELDQF